MNDDDDVLSIFEDLTPSQAKELRRRIIPALTEIRDEIINPSDDGNQKGVDEMNSDNSKLANVFNGLPSDLTDDEVVQLVEDMRGVVEKVKRTRHAAGQEALREEYTRELMALPRGSASRNSLNAIKSKFKARGLDVDRIVLNI